MTRNWRTKSVEQSIRDTDELQRVLLMVSKFDHCLGDLLYRARIGELPMEVVGIIGNAFWTKAIYGVYINPYLNAVAGFGFSLRHIPRAFFGTVIYAGNEVTGFSLHFFVGYFFDFAFNEFKT